MEKYKYSAADLVKKSAAQILYFRNRREAVSERMLQGVKYQSKITEEEKLLNKGSIAEELRGAYEFDTGIIFFCVDMISDNKFYEIKSILDEDHNSILEYEEWYLQSSLLQAAFYKSLLLCKDDKMLYTPKFRLKEGYEFVYKEINPKWDYILKFGDVGDYKVDVKYPDKIIEYFIDKTNHITTYEEARAWDSTHKFKDFENLNKYFKYKKLKN